MDRSGEPQTSSSSRYLAGAWALTGAILCAAMISLEPSLLEEGLILHVAQRMAHGEHLYRDIVFFSGPLPFELLSLLFRIFGEEVSVGRWALVVFQGAGCAALFDIARRAGARASAHAAAACLAAAPVLLFPLYSTYFYTTLAVHLSLLAAWTALRGLDSMGWAFAAGVLVSCVALTKQTVGVVLAPGLLLVLGLCAAPAARPKALAGMIGGGLVSLLATLGLYGLRGDVGVLLDSLVFLPLSLGETFSSGYVNLWPPGSFDAEIQGLQSYYVPHLYNMLTGRKGNAPVSIVLLTQLLYLLPFAALVLTLARRARYGAQPPALWAHAVVLLALLANLFPRSDWGHLVFVLPAAAAQTILSLRPREGLLDGRIARAAAALLVLALGAASLSGALRLHRMAGEATFGERVAQRPVSRTYKSPGIPRAIAFVRARTQPGDPIFVARAEPLVYFATDTRNPTRYVGVVPGLQAEQGREIVERLGEVDHVVMSEIDSAVFVYYGDELPTVQDYLERHFRLPLGYRKKSSWVVVLERGQDRGETAVDLLSPEIESEAWILDALGRRAPAAAEPPRFGARHNRRPLAVVLGPNGGGVDFEVLVPPKSVFQADVGIRRLGRGAKKRLHAPGTRLSVEVGEGSMLERLAQVDLGAADALGKSWSPLEADLSDYAGRRVTLRLRVSASRPLPQGALAWWGSPRLALQPEDD